MKIIDANFTQTTDNQGNDIILGKATFTGFGGSNKLKNSNGTEYRLGNITFIGADKKVYQSSAAIYDKVMDKNNFAEGDVVSIAGREYNGEMYLSILGATGVGTLSATSGAFGVVKKVAEEVEASA